MEVYDDSNLESNDQLIVLMHLSQLLFLCTALGGLIVPLIIWLTQKDKVTDLDRHGKQILNFQISMIIAAIISIPLIFALGLGVLMLIGIGILTLVLPIVAAIKASNREFFEYPFTIEFLK